MDSEKEKQALNKLILEFFIVNGMKEAAETFQKESNKSCELPGMAERIEMTEAIKDGNIDSALTKLRQHQSTLLDQHPDVEFALKKQALIEMIKKGDSISALKFAQTELAPSASNQEERLRQLESVMGLLLFPDPSKSPDSALVSRMQRETTAQQLNAALLTAQGYSSEPKLFRLLQAISWAEKQCRERNIDVPPLNDIYSAALNPHVRIQPPQDVDDFMEDQEPEMDESAMDVALPE